MTPDKPTARHPAPPLVVKVFAFADRGMAMAHVDGKIAFIPFAAPGDVAEIEVVRQRKRYLQARLLRILEPSPLRRSPECPHFTRCGGCQWQHVSYPEQLHGKAQSYRNFVKSRLGLRDDTCFLPPLPSPTEWGYRNRVGLKVRTVAGTPTLGFFHQGSHRLVAVEQCPVADPRINQLLPPLAEFLRHFAPAHGALPQVDLQVDGTGSLHLVLHLLRPLAPAEERELHAFCHTHPVAAAWQQRGRKHTLDRVHGGATAMSFPQTGGERPLQLHLSPGGFVQANSAVNALLLAEVYKLRSWYRDKTVLDLFCGAGNFTLPMAIDAAQVIGIEGYPPAARDGAANARRNGLSRVQVLAMPVQQGLLQLCDQGTAPDFVLLDPPREGAASAIEPLAALAPEGILYISCAPPTLVRDLKQLRTHGYRLHWTRIADMFPQTAHVESMTLLLRDGFDTPAPRCVK